MKQCFETYQSALVRMSSEFLNQEANPVKAEAMLREAAANGAKLVCFPESFDIGYVSNRIADMEAHARQGDSTTLARMCTLAKELEVYILVPVSWRNPDGTVENRAFLVDDGGVPLGGYSKTHLTAAEQKSLSRGEGYPVFDTNLGEIGIALCYDIYFPEAGGILASKGAEVILVPAAWRGSSYFKQWWDINVSSRALDNLVYVAAVNMTGPANMKEEFAGKARSVAPGERSFVGGGVYEEKILYGWIDRKRLGKERQENTVLFDRHPLDYRIPCEQCS